MSTTVSHGPLELPGLDPDQAQQFVWRVFSANPSLTERDREVGRLVELCQWPYPQGDTPARTVYAAIIWLDPSAAASDDLRLAGRPVRVLEG